MITMLEETAVFAAGYTAALLVSLILGIMLFGVFWAKTGVRHK